MLSTPRLQSFATTNDVSSFSPVAAGQSASQTSASAGSPWTIKANPIQVDPAQWRKQNDVSQLDQAEALAQDAFRRVSPFNPNPSAPDKFAAQLEMQEAQTIRNQVRGDLTASQQQQLDQIQGEEKQAFTDATSVGGGFAGNLRRDFAVTKMIDAAGKEKTLDSSVLGTPSWLNGIQPLMTK